jgi:linoleoyl-CoA desaturase
MVSYFSWVFVLDFIKYIKGRIGDTKMRSMDLKEHIWFWTTKVLYLFIFIAFPMFKIGILSVLVGYLVVAFTCGFVTSLVFQLAHVVEDAAFPKPDSNTHKIEEQWAIHQVNTTVDFATNNKLITWLTGGLNFQVEHHLFPKISHVHYPEINKLVKQTCGEFHIQYHEYPSLFKAIRSHVLQLKLMGVA